MTQMELLAKELEESSSRILDMTQMLLANPCDLTTMDNLLPEAENTRMLAKAIRLESRKMNFLDAVAIPEIDLSKLVEQMEPQL